MTRKKQLDPHAGTRLERSARPHGISNLSLAAANAF